MAETHLSLSCIIYTHLTRRHRASHIPPYPAISHHVPHQQTAAPPTARQNKKALVTTQSRPSSCCLQIGSLLLVFPACLVCIAHVNDERLWWNNSTPSPLACPAPFHQRQLSSFAWPWSCPPVACSDPLEPTPGSGILSLVSPRPRPIWPAQTPHRPNIPRLAP